MFNTTNTVIDGKFIHCKWCGRTVGVVIDDLAGDRKIMKYNELRCKSCDADVRDIEES